MRATKPLRAVIIRAGIYTSKGNAVRTGRYLAIALTFWTIGFARDGGAPAEVSVDDASGAATPPSAPKPETIARTMRRWHDGTGMGFAFQAIIFLGGILPAALAVTGVLMWFRSRRWRADVARRRTVAMAPAE